MIVLAVDIGNSQTKLGFFDGDMLCGGRRRVPTDSRRTVAAWIELLRDSATRRIGARKLDGVAICSSAPEATSSLLASVEPAFGISDPLILGPDTDFGMDIHYDPPESVGRDRLANALAAREMPQFRRSISPKLIVDFGTATTMDVLTADGDFAGGAIAAGLGVTSDALFASARHLPAVDLVAPASVVGHSTTEALQSGIVLGHVLMVERMVDRVWRELGDLPRIIATGGWADTLVPALRHVIVAGKDANLTLYGIYYAWRLNRPGAQP